MITETTGGAPAAGAGETIDTPGTPANAAPVAATPADALSIGAQTPAAPAAQEAVPVAYEQTGDVGLDMALSFVGERGFGPDHPAMKAATTGDFGPLRAALGALGDKAKGFEGFLALAEKAHKETESKHQTRRTEDAAKIEAAVGGKDQWAAIRTWAGEATEDSPQQRAEVNAALKQGGMVAVAMAQHLATLYSRAAGTTKDPAGVVAPGATGRPAADAPLSAKGYAQETQALRQKLGYNFESSAEYRNLQGRRQAAIRAGH